MNLLDKNEDKLYKEKLEEYKKIKSEFNNNPLYSNYIQTKEKLNDLLVQISEILSSL